jgi:hypothetical protein
MNQQGTTKRAALSLSFYALFILSLLACKTPDTGLANEVPLFGSTNMAPQAQLIDDVNRGEFGEHGVIFKAKKNDTINLAFKLSGNLASSIQQKPVQVRLKRDIWIFAIDDTVMVSLDGKNYEPIDDVLSGELSAEFSLIKESKTNQINIEMKADKI